MSHPAIGGYKLKCSVEGCNLPHGYIVNGVLVIDSEHHGHKHRYMIPLADLLREAGIDSEAEKRYNDTVE